MQAWWSMPGGLDQYGETCTILLQYLLIAKAIKQFAVYLWDATDPYNPPIELISSTILSFTISLAMYWIAQMPL